MPLNCDDAAGIDEDDCSDIRSSAADVDECRVGDGDGEDRRFLFSVATIASFAFLICQKINCTIARFNCFFLLVWTFLSNYFWFERKSSLLSFIYFSFY